MESLLEAGGTSDALLKASVFSLFCCVAGDGGLAAVGDLTVLALPATTVAEEDRLSVLEAIVGVPTMDDRDLSGGGPIDPRFDGVGRALVEVLRRVLLLKAAILVEPSADGLRSLVRSTPNSDVNEDGRDILGATETEDSRRWCVCVGLLDWDGVFPAVPRTPTRRLS